MTNQILTWNDLGATGTAISFDNYDDAHSMPVNIGFNFGFCGVTFSQFVINTNGFIKLGNIHSTTTFNREPPRRRSGY